jgi:hypothetical protein
MNPPPIRPEAAAAVCLLSVYKASLETIVLLKLERRLTSAGVVLFDSMVHSSSQIFPFILT